MLAWLKSVGYSTYIYAPKQDASLRGRWAEPFTEQSYAQLSGLRKEASRQQLGFGLGLSPLGAVHDFSSASQRRCDDKLAQIKTLELDTLCILFDDMICSMPDLAQRQCEIVEYIRQRVGRCNVIMCPTYYSYDPVLEKVFGCMPEHYWQALGEQLSHDVDVFWTGNAVCAPSISCQDLEDINAAFKRKVVIWDNYPVNDGEKASKFLHLKPFQGREAELASVVAGHYCNPMNQSELSKLALYSLPKIYANEVRSEKMLFDAACRDVLPERVAVDLKMDAASFNDRGLMQLSDNQKRALIDKYSKHTGLAAAELVDWLQDGYLFDPACLTEAIE